MSDLYRTVNHFDQSNDRLRIDVTAIRGTDDVRIRLIFMLGENSGDALVCATKKLADVFSHHVRPFGRLTYVTESDQKDAHIDIRLIAAKLSDVGGRSLMERLVAIAQNIADEFLKK